MIQLHWKVLSEDYLAMNKIPNESFMTFDRAWIGLDFGNYGFQEKLNLIVSIVFHKSISECHDFQFIFLDGFVLKYVYWMIFKKFFNLKTPFKSSVSFRHKASISTIKNTIHGDLRLGRKTIPKPTFILFILTLKKKWHWMVHSKCFWNFVLWYSR